MIKIFALCLLLTFPIWAENEEKPLSPTVTITNPAGGQCSERIINVQGTISDSSITRAYIVINSSANMFDVAGGSFTYSVVLAPGENIIQIIAENNAGTGRDALAVYSHVPKRDVKVVMTWDTPTDMDLHVIDPNSEETFYSSKESKIGGQLDHDDTDGFGPETFMLSNAIDGKYIVKAKYYGGGAGQTKVKMTVILFEGTPKEERKDYFALLSKPSEVTEICSFLVSQE